MDWDGEPESLTNEKGRKEKKHNKPSFVAQLCWFGISGPSGEYFSTIQDVGQLPDAETDVEGPL